MSAGSLDKVLMNPKRFLIATALYLRGPSTMAELKRITGLEWGDLESNIRRLREAGYVAVRKVPTLKGPRTVVELTPAGRARYERLVEELERIIKRVRSEGD
jgi:DNA-binding MarR family transcriptional regulator